MSALPPDVLETFGKYGLTIRPMQGYYRVQGGKNLLEFRASRRGKLGFRLGTDGSWMPLDKLNYLIGYAHADL